MKIKREETGERKGDATFPTTVEPSPISQIFPCLSRARTLDEVRTQAVKVYSITYKPDHIFIL